MAPSSSVFIAVPTVLQQILAQLQSSGSAITDFTTGSVARSLCEAFAVVVSGQSAVADQLALDSYLDTATGPALDALGVNWMVARNPAVQATGQVTITRQSTGGALTIPAGWGQLVTTPAIAGGQGVAVLTTADADFPAGVASVTVPAQAVLGGAAGNLAAGTFLTPLSPVNGVSSQNGIEVTSAFTNGVDAESDQAYAARIPLVVQGRVGGRVSSFQAAALSVPGVLSVGVLSPGMNRSDGSVVPAATAEIYYEGAVGLLSQVTSGVAAAATATQSVNTFAAVSLAAPRGQQRVVADVVVWVPPGVSTTTTQAAVAQALQTYVDGVPLGGTAYMSQAAQAVLAVPGVASVDLPFSAFSLYGRSGATDVSMVAADSYPALAAADTTVTVQELATL